MLVMTFNMRFENDRDGENAWAFRRDIVTDIIAESSPAILGTQEGTRGQLAFLRERLPGYRMQAAGRIWDDTCQYPTLFFRDDLFRLLDGGEFWLSKTPSVHRSKNWDSAFPRMMSYGFFKDLQDSKEFWAVVTHLDHMGSEARVEQAKILADWLASRREPRILMGDFNDHPGSMVHRVLTSPGTGLRDTWQVLLRGEDEASMTHHNFGGVPQQWRMDWILASREFRALEARIIRSNREGRYPSDHFPYAVDLSWERKD